jgi:hypothetical protein
MVVVHGYLTASALGVPSNEAGRRDSLWWVVLDGAILLQFRPVVSTPIVRFRLGLGLG